MFHTFKKIFRFEYVFLIKFHNKGLDSMVLLGYYCQRHKNDTCNVTCNESFIDAPVVKSPIHTLHQKVLCTYVETKTASSVWDIWPTWGHLFSKFFSFFFFFEIDVYPLRGTLKRTGKLE